MDTMSDYDSYRDARDAETRKAYAEWEKQDPAGYAAAKAAGVGEAKIDPHRPPRRSDDEDEEKRAPLAIVHHDFADPEPEEIVLQALVDAGLITSQFSRPMACTVILSALEQVYAIRDKASASREADAMLHLLYLLGAAKNREMSFRARVLQALIAKNERSLASIGKEFRVTRADVSKVAREMKAFLRLKIGGATRNDAYSEQARERAHRVHDFRKSQLREADEFSKAA